MDDRISIIGVVPNDDKWKKMKAVYDACIIAKTSLPDEVYDFFRGGKPDPNGNLIDLTDRCVERDDDVNTKSLDLSVESIPTSVKNIKFVIVNEIAEFRGIGDVIPCRRCKLRKCPGWDCDLLQQTKTEGI